MTYSTHGARTSRHSRPAGGFTLLELLIVIAIIFLLVTIVITSMQAVRAASNRANTIGALRQMITGFGAYTTDHGGKLMPGYLDDALVTQLGVQAEFSDGEPISVAASRSYAWRLAPYLDYAWEAYFEDFRSEEMTSRLRAQYIQVPGAPAPTPAEVDAATLEISEMMSIGMNSLFVGGDSAHGGAPMTTNHPWINAPDGNPSAWAVTNLANARNPAKLIVFAPAGRFDTWDNGLAVYEKPAGAAHEFGFPEVRPPWLPDAAGDFVNQQWDVGTGGAISEPTAGSLITSVPAGALAGAGLPHARWGTDVYPVANLDGSTTSESLSQLSDDMTRWTNFSLAELQNRGFSP